MTMQFTFGRPVEHRKPAVGDSPRIFVLGAYPSALHVRWHAPNNRLHIQAVAVDNEPEPFWTGSDQRQRVEAWRKAVRFKDDWGRVEECGSLNGSSGQWVESQILAPLRVSRNEAWITDCLDTYCESNDAKKRLESEPIVSFLKEHRIPTRSLDPHPSENEIVERALSGHMQRLRGELEKARPERVVTLGNAALRVLRGLIESGAPRIKKLSTESYGKPFEVTICGKDVQWYPLAHPASPPRYQDAHASWIKHLRTNG